MLELEFTRSCFSHDLREKRIKYLKMLPKTKVKEVLAKRQSKLILITRFA